MDAFNRFHKCFFDYERTLLRLIGHDYLKPNFKPGIVAYFIYTLTAIFLFTNTYTILFYEPFTILNGCVFMNVSVVVSVTQDIDNYRHEFNFRMFHFVVSVLRQNILCQILRQFYVDDQLLAQYL